MTQSDLQHLHLLKDVEFQPVFIMGDHRSGTTLLYQLLARSGHFGIVTAYHILAYGSLLEHHLNGTDEVERMRMSDRFSELGLGTRLIDNVKLTPDLPEEYGFLFTDCGSKPRLNDRTLPLFKELCRKVQYLSPRDMPLLLKNPWDYNNFVYVKRAFPSSRFVFIHRSPVNVINSQLRATRALLTAESAYQALLAEWYRKLFATRFRLPLVRRLFSSPLGVFIVMRHVERAAHYLLRHISDLPESDYVSVRYEDLCGKPQSTVQGILSFLNLSDTQFMDYGALIDPRDVRLLPEVKSREHIIERKLRPYLRYVGYRI
jgi:hypothetical protein